MFGAVLFMALAGPPACAPACAIEVPACAAVVRHREVTRTVVRVERVRRCRSCEPQACAKVEACAPIAACAPAAACDKCGKVRTKTRTVVRVDRPHVVAHVAVAVLPPYRHRCECE